MHTDSDIYNQAFSHFGMHRQVIKTVEELTELSQALCKYLYDVTEQDHVAEEIADVLIMIEQLKAVIDYREIDRHKKAKLDRLKSLITPKA